LPTKLKAVLFDIDDTLFDRELSQVLSLDHFVEKYPVIFNKSDRTILWQAWMESGRLTDVDFVAGRFDRGARSRYFLKLLNLPNEIADDLTRLYLEYYPTLKVPIEGALPLIHQLLRSVKVGVISNSLPDVQYRKIQTLGLTNLLSCIVLSEELGIRKPDPRVFQHAAGLLRVQSPECLFVGDSFSADVIGAKAAGMQACWLNRHASPLPPAPQPRPDYVISSLTHLVPILERDGLFI
jgi:HAD superfamily hydrolase (TIGR01509 family)